MKKFFPLFLSLLICFTLHSQVTDTSRSQNINIVSRVSTEPAGYYDAANGLTCAPLKTALSAIITTGMTPKTYGDLWIQYLISDVKPREVGPGTSPDVIWDIYSDNPGGPDPYNFTPGAVASGGQQDNGTAAPSEGIFYNREHSVPLSWFNGNTGTSGPATDYFHIFPTDKLVNAMRANYNYGVVSSPTFTSQNGSKLGPNIYPGLSGTAFEPITEFKGDIARAFFYFVTRYESNISGWETSSTEGNVAFAGNTWPSIELPYLKLMLQWNSVDPVSQKEIDRNDAGYTYQGNRNPFIDHPEFVGQIWSQSCGLALPVDLVEFKGKLSGNNVLLNWKVERVDGFSHFEIERSMDGGVYTKAGAVNWLANQSEYLFADDVSYISGKILYRLKMVDQTNVFKYSKVLTINLPAADNITSVYPNPAKETLNISFRKKFTSNVRAYILDASGRNVGVSILGSGQSNYQLDVSDLSNGMYLLKCVGESGTSYIKFLVQK